MKTIITKKRLPGAFAYRLLLLVLQWLIGRIAYRNIENGYPQVGTFAFDRIGTSINLHGRYENDELQLIKEWLEVENKLGGLCIDIGANIGNHALFFSSYFSKVIAFEPNPRTFTLLELNSKLACNIVCHQVALSDANGEALLRFEPLNVGGASIAVSDEGRSMSEQGYRVELRKLDSIDLKGQKVQIMKIDVEGHEAQVLRGARQTILKDRPVILFEQHEGEFQDDASPVIDLIKSFGYHRFAVVERQPWLWFAWLSALLRLTLGEKIVMKSVSSFKPRFYSMVVAIPD